jgi:autotransporter-associated beta strand protein
MSRVQGRNRPVGGGFLLVKCTPVVSLAVLAVGSLFAATGRAQAQQLPLSAFQTYNAADAAAIVPGTFSLFEVPVSQIQPGQLNVGFAEIGNKQSGWNLLTASQLQAALLNDIEPVVIGPGGVLYLENGHHTFTSLENSIFGASDPTVFVNVIANYSNLTTAQFWAAMAANNLVLPLNNGIAETINPLTGAPVPTSLQDLTNDPYRGLEYSILKNKSSKLFTSTSNITGAKGASTPGLDKLTGDYSDFIWADAYRYANGGLGLPYLTPGDIALATKWNLNPNSTTTLPNIGAVTVGQLPGFILNNNITISSTISNATLSTGTLAANGTFTGITDFNLGTPNNPVMVGTPQSGFVMQLGADAGNSVTLSGNNTYTGGTTLIAGSLMVTSDAALGAAAPAGYTINPNGILASVQAANGIVFNSEDEGAATLTTTTSFSTNRPIAVDGETATLAPASNTTLTLTGQIASLGTAGVGLGNESGASNITIDGGSNSTSNVVLAPSTGSNSLFFGDWIITSGTLKVSSDASLGNTIGPSYEIGQIELNGGTFQTDASFSSVRTVTLQSKSTFDTDGFTSSFASLVDPQRGLTITNSGTGAGAVTFGSFEVAGGLELTVNKGSGTSTTATFTNGIIRDPNATLLIAGSSTGSLGTNTFVKSGVGASTLANGIAPAWIIIDSASGSGNNNPYDFATYSTATGYGAFTGYTTSFGASSATTVDKISASTNLTANTAAYAVNFQRGQTVGGAFTLTVGDGTDPAGVIMNGTNGNPINLNMSTLAFGGSEGIIYVAGSQTSAASNVINAEITGSGGLTLSGVGMLTIAHATAETGAIVVDAGTLNLAVADAFKSSTSGIFLTDTKNLATANLAMNQSQTFSAVNSAGNNSTIIIDSTGTGGGSMATKLTIGDSQNLNSTISSLILQEAATGATGSAIPTPSGSAVTGIITKEGTGLLDLSGMKSGTLDLVAGSTIAINAGQLRVAANIFLNPNAVSVASGAEFQFAEGGGAAFGGNISGGGDVRLIGGTLQLTGTGNTYSGGTFVEVGSILSLTTANVSTGNANITLDGGTVLFDQKTNGTYTGVISNGTQMSLGGAALAGTFIKDDSATGSGGNVTLANVQAYTGMTYIEAGTLTLGAVDTIASSSGVDLGRVGGAVCTPSPCPAVTATLALGANNTIQGLMDEGGNNTAVLLNGNTLTMNVTSGLAFSYGGVISGTGGLIMTGTGSETLTGTSTYTGTTIVNGGLLNIDGSIASSSLTTVNGAGALGGTGTVGNTFINGGTLAPGNGSGTLTVSGNLAFTTAAAYLIGVSQSGSALTSVTGTATLAGTVIVVSPTSTYRFEQPTTILSAAGGLGGTTFNALALPDFITGSLSYTSTSAQLTLALALGQVPGLNANQMQVASAIDRGVNARGTLPSGFANLLNLSPSALPSALSQLSGEIGTGAQQTTFGAMTQFVSSLIDHMTGADVPVSTPGASQYADDPSAANAYASNANTSGTKSERDAYAAIYNKAPPRPADPFAQGWSVWAGGFGGSQTTDGNASLGSSGSTSQIYGSVVGADYRISPFTVAGLALAGGGTNFSVNGLGSGRSDLFQAGVFIKHNIGAAYISGALGYGWQNITTDRTVTLAGVDQLRANFDANAFSGRLEGGYRFVAPWMGLGVTPYAAGQFTTFELPAYAEQALAGSNTFALSYASQSITDSRSELGLRTDKSYALTNAVLTLRGRLAWAHDFDTDRGAAATFQSLPGASFVVNGAAPAHDSALTTASAEVKWLNGFSVAATFEGEFSDVTQSYAGKGTVRYSW